MNCGRKLWYARVVGSYEWCSVVVFFSVSFVDLIVALFWKPSVSRYVGVSVCSLGWQGM